MGADCAPCADGDHATVDEDDLCTCCGVRVLCGCSPDCDGA